jgi:hypothetical protein
MYFFNIYIFLKEAVMGVAAPMTSVTMHAKSRMYVKHCKLFLAIFNFLKGTALSFLNFILNLFIY